MGVWVLFAIMLLTGPGSTGEPVINYHPFKTQAECEAAKTKVTEAIAAKSPGSDASIVCFYLPEPGKIV